MSRLEPPFDDSAPRADEEAVLRRLLAELAGGQESAPDLTDRVMGRLGFVRCTETERRRAGRASALRRAAIMALMLVAAVAGYWVASQRAPADGMALSPAIGGVIERHGQSLRVVFDGLPRWTVPGAMPASAVMRTSGTNAVPVIFVPMPDEGCRGGRRWIDHESEEASPALRRTAARLPFPEA